MKVCLVIGSLRAGGAERVAASLANHWASKGWSVSLVTLSATDEDFYGVRPEVNRVGLALEGRSRGTLGGGRSNLRRLRELRRVVRSVAPRIVVGFLPTSNILGGLAGASARATVIGSEHLYPPSEPLPLVWRQLRRRVYPRLAAVTAPTEDTAAWFRTHLGLRNLRVIPNPVPYPLPESGPPLAPADAGILRHGGRLLLAVGRLHRQKGFDLLLQAFHHLRHRYPQWRLAILGEGPLRAELEALRAALGLEASVVLPGAVSNIGGWYSVADAYVLSSRYEGFGNTLAEALSYGVPAVAVDCRSGPREILRDGLDGVLVPPDGLESLVQGLDRIMGDEGFRRACAAHAPEARQRFSVERIGSLWEALFEELTG